MSTIPVLLSTRRRRLARQLLLAVSAAALISLLAASASGAAITSFGSPLSGPATLDTAEDLDYAGTNTNVPASPEAPLGYVHTYHFGADTALWNEDEAVGSARAPSAGQAVKVSLEGCAVPTPGGPPPLTQIHFQSLSPLPGGGAKINVTSQPLEIKVCGVDGVSGSTVTTYDPIKLCVDEGDYIAFNDEGGFVGHSYQSGVPYRVLGSAKGSKVASFIRGGGTNTGDMLSALDTSNMDGFVLNGNKELMLRVTLATGKDASLSCPGGTLGKLAPIRVSPQTDGVNHSRIVAVALYCRVSPCNGTATLSSGGKTYGRSGFALQPNKTAHLPIRISSDLIDLIRKNHGASATLTAAVGGETVSRRIAVKIF